MNYDDKVVYQVYPKSFKDTNGDGIGDINGIISKLDYLDELGVDYIWLSPINKSPQYDNGYDISDYYEIDKMFGTKADYKNLISKAQEKGIKIMMDLVLNHVSSESEWFKKAINGEQYYQDFFIWRDEPNEIMSYFSLPAWTYCKEVGKYYFHLFDKHQPDLNWDNKNVRTEIYKMINYWIEFGVEGFRLDVIDLIGKDPDKYITSKGPKFYRYLEELHDNTFKNKILTVGECSNSTLEDSYKMCEKKGLTQIFHFTEQSLTSKESKWEQSELNLKQLVDVIVEWNNFYKSSQTRVLNNHDLPRLVSLWLDDTKYHYEASTMLLTLFSFFRGTLYLYQGDEIGMTNDNKKDILLYNDVETLNEYNRMKESGKYSEKVIMQKLSLISRDNSRTPMQWDDTKYGGFSDVEPWLNLNYRFGEINVKNDLSSSKSIYYYLKDLIQYRKLNYNEIISQKIVSYEIEDKLIIINRSTYKMYINFSKSDIINIGYKGKVIYSNYKEESQEIRPYEIKIIAK